MNKGHLAYRPYIESLLKQHGTTYLKRGSIVYGMIKA